MGRSATLASRAMKKLWLPLSAAVALVAAGCGSSGSRGPSLSGVPLVPGTQVVEHVRRCDPGANPYCAVQLVVVDKHASSSQALLIAERQHLKSLGWTLTEADTGDEAAANSPGHKLRLTYATAALDLKDIDLGWIRRSPKIGLALSRAMFDRDSAISLMLQTGSA
jgi:hypothetical protein